MLTLTKLLPSAHVGIASLLVGAVLIQARPAFAQIDVTPPMPNVLILLDTSGSMTRKIGSDAFPNCSADVPADLNGGRWFAVVQALTGTLPTTGGGAIECEELDRGSAPFASAYGSGLYDTGYYLPFQRIQSGDCAYVPDDTELTWSSPLTISDFPSTAIVAKNGGSACGFSQSPNGIIDAYKRSIRFGLMTFDPGTDPQVGLDDGASGHVNAPEGHDGTWSYWFKSGTQNYMDAARPPTYSNLENDPADDGIAKGKPPACGTLLPMEVGARGPAAPPWEGRLMGFGDYEADSQAVSDQNERIEKVILSMRPYGATPMAGMLSDAKDFLLQDTTQLGSGANAVPLGPRDDPYWDQGDGCRPLHIVVITDGEPNLDLRPGCEENDPSGDAALDGVCPFSSVVHANDGSTWVEGDDVDQSIVNKLAIENNVTFHVIGISLTQLTDPDPAALNQFCAQYSAAGTQRDRCEVEATTPGSITAQERTCCLLNAISDVGGGGDTAYFVDDIAGLQGALNIVLTDISSGTATRTAPVYQSVAPTFYVENTTAAAVGHEMLSSLKTTVGDGLWSGRLERIRIACEDLDGAGGAPPAPDRQAFDRTLGDDFGHNIAASADSRYMITVLPTVPEEDTWQSLRPDLLPANDDGLAQVDIGPPIVGLASAWVSSVDEDAFVLDASSGGDCEQKFGGTINTEALCRTELLKWFTGMDSLAIGVSDIGGNPTDGDRCPFPNDAENCKTLGAIYHTQPIIVGPPREFLRDESYDVFAKTFEARPTVVYASTIDGQLHAFLLADNTARLSPQGQEISQVDQRELSELWSFVPPIALPYLKDGVNRHKVFLDGGLTAKNVVFERLVADAIGTVADFTAKGYRTALVASSGRVAEAIPGGGYYFALDVTDPHAEDEDFNGMPDGSPDDESPKFLWQLSRGSGGVNDPLFGDAVPSASVTTISYQPDAASPREVAVAILAGGMSDPPSGAPVFPAGSEYDGSVTVSGNNGTRTIREWGPSRADRSVTIARIDTGEVLMRFRGLGTDPIPFNPTRMRTAGFQAPMSGTPVAFPGLPGQISTRVYMGDAEGVLWVLDLSSPNPADWEMKVAWDAYGAFGSEIENGDFVPGPVETVPVISVDASGNPVVVFATGGQEDFNEMVGKNFVVALRDDPDDIAGDGPGLDLAWQLDLEAGGAIDGGPGHRVTGPLNIFDSKVFFGTFKPSGNPCELGVGRIWGVRYIEAGPVGIMGVAADQLFEENAEVIAFGVSIGQQPSCRNDVPVVPPADNIFGSYTTFETAAPGAFELVVQSGRRGTVAGSGEATTKTLTIPLTTARSTVRVDSWAAIVE